nr:TRAP transporter large permease subunit [Desulfopila sp. IMCC35008]
MVPLSQVLQLLLNQGGTIGVVGAIVLSILFKHFKTEMFLNVGLQTATLVSVAMWIIFGASVFSNFHLLMGVQSIVSDFALNLDLPPICVIIVLMCAPLITPITVSLGYDPVWVGVLMILNILIAVQTPPYGFALFYLKGIAPPGVGIATIYRSVVPFVMVNLTVLILCMLFPQIALWGLPNKVLG